MARVLRSVVVALCSSCAGVGVGAAQDAGQIVYKPGPDTGIVPPQVVREVKPQYAADAMRAGVQGAVELEFVVLADGTVGDVRVTRSVHAGLDEEAVRAVKQWTFKPGTKDGEPVAVQVNAELTFTLRRDEGVKLVNIVVKPGQVVTHPRTTRTVKPLYTAAAKKAGIEGNIVLEATVNPDGTVANIRVTQPLDPGLDREAVKAVSQWLFRPGTKDGKPVPVQVEILLAFALR
jgi:TonB family protein